LNPNGVKIRTAGTDKAPLFCLSDVCRVLGIARSNDKARELDDEDKVAVQTRTPGGTQEMVFVTESGLYVVILRSDKPQARPFQQWVTKEVLPCIREYGCYPAPTAFGAPADEDDLLSLQLRAALELRQRQLNVEKVQAAQATQLAEVADRVDGLLAERRELAANGLHFDLENEPPAQVGDRAKLNAQVRFLARLSDLTPEAIWGKVYYHLLYRYGFNVWQHAENSGNSKIEEVIIHNMAKPLLRIISELIRAEQAKIDHGQV
jgi:prophage antirepressor-like protein